MNNLNNAYSKSNLKFFNFTFHAIRNTIDEFFLKLSLRIQKKELKQFQTALNNINSTFLHRYGYKYGYVRPAILSDINLEVLKRLKNKKKSEIDGFKQKVTARGLTYVVIYQTCVSFINTYNNSTSGDNPYSETLLELIQFSLDGLNHEKLKSSFQSSN